MQAVLLVNLDRFKTVNDSLGYHAGDLLLQSVAQRLTNCVRDCDTVARFGSDEFAILLTQIPRAQDAANTAHAIKEALVQPFIYEEQEICVSNSIGISLHPHDGRDTATLLKSAGAALDRAKEQGGNNYQFYTAGGTTRALRQLVLESNLRPGLERKNFHYQPQVTVNDCHLVGMEALVRWQHRVSAYISRNSSLAEEVVDYLTGLGVSRCLFPKQNWQQLGLKLMRLAVNFPPTFQQHFHLDCREILKRRRTRIHMARIRITEFDNEGSELAIEVTQLKMMGIKVAIDDFGTDTLR